MRSNLITLSLLLLIALSVSACKTRCISISPGELKRIGMLIFINEGSGKEENLTVWNEGEEFASLGIGHFLWYPEGKEYRFRETFPLVFEFIKARGATVPEWMNELPSFDLPWNSREEFYLDFNAPEMVSLREFLLDTIPIQTLFIAERLEDSLPKILSAAPDPSRPNIKKQFYRVADSPMGMYVLMDYVNFKGEGTAETERYKGEGWGLLQVLDNMKGDEPGPQALREFADSAEEVLLRRVKNSPPARNEKRWIIGWRNRLNTYTSRDLYAYSGEYTDGEADNTPNPIEYVVSIYRRLVCRLL